jgi:xylulokinase
MFEASLSIEHHAVPGFYVTFLYNQAGSLVKWHRNTFAAQERTAAGEDIYDRLTAEMPDEPTRLLVLPHFEPTGAPGCIDATSGVILGLHTSTTRGDILKAIMECETFYFLEAAETLARLGVKSESYIASGGGAKSDRWLQIKADVMGVPYERASETEAGALGVAMIAAKATGVFASYKEACRQWLRLGRVFEPDSRRHAFYREKFEHYRQLYPRLHDILEYADGRRSD